MTTVQNKTIEDYDKMKPRQEKSDTELIMNKQTQLIVEQMKKHEQKKKNLTEEKRKLEQSMNRHEYKMRNQTGTSIRTQIINNIKRKNQRRHHKMMENRIQREIKQYEMLQKTAKMRRPETPNSNTTENRQDSSNQLANDIEMQTDDAYQEKIVNFN